MTKSLSDYQEKDFLDNGKVKITNDWFTDQVRSYINEEDFENFLHKCITVEDLTEDIEYVMKIMIFKSSETIRLYSQLDFIKDSIHTIVALYNKFGKSMYEYEKKVLIADIHVLVKDLKSDKIEDTIQKLPSFYAFEAAMYAHRFDNTHKLIEYIEIDKYFQFIIEDEKEGVKALKNDWRHFKLWKFYRRLEKQGKIPVYKDKEIEDALWASRSEPDYSLEVLFGDMDNIKTITPFDETIARKIIDYRFFKKSKVLLYFHIHGVFAALKRYYVPVNMFGDIPKRVLSELFKNGWHLNDYFKETIDAITSSYDNKPEWWGWDISFYSIPTAWNDWILVEWLFQKLRTSFKSMVKTRTYYMHGIKVQYDYFHKIDEIRPEDLVNGIKTSPSVAFKNSAIRLQKTRTEENAKLPEAPFKETDSVKQIKYSTDFVEEGNFMHNCVAGYIDSAKNEHCFIYHVGVNIKHGTMEVNREGEVVQLYGPYNEEPDPSVLNAVEEWLKINNLKTSEVVKRWKNYMNNETFDEDEFY